MKYVVILADGMAGLPLSELSGNTTLSYAKTPFMDYLASCGRMGLVHTVPETMSPGSDVANLSVLGYDPLLCYSGRSSLEALSVGVSMSRSDVVFRANLVSLTEADSYSRKVILDHSSGEISTEDANILMDAIRQAFQTDTFKFYTGTSYRHIMVWDKGRQSHLEPPHDHLGKVIGPYLPKDPVLRTFMEKSFEVLNNHPLNIQRQKQGLNKANSLWFWGPGTKPSLASFESKTGLKAVMISAVDLLKGIAVGSGMRVLTVPGANGSLDTNYIGKADAALQALLDDGADFAYIHVEAPDEMGHQGSVSHKIESIERIDQLIVGRVFETLKASGEPFRIMILPDHPTPIVYRTHTKDPVPYLIYDSRYEQRKTACFSEREAGLTGNRIDAGYKLMDLFIEKE